MNKKGFTLIELIAVVVIMAIIALIATPNIINMLDKGKKTDYLADAREFITQATYMYKQDKYRTDPEIFQSGKIFLKDIQGIRDYDDPYGYKYDTDYSFVKFESASGTGLQERKVTIRLKSCDETKSNCFEIYDVDKNDLSVSSIKETNK